MGLPWVRLDSNIANHDKVLELVSKRDGFRAFTVYVCGLGYSGAHSTDGLIPGYALAHIHGTEKHARLLVDTALWTYDPDGKGWLIRNWDQRQELSVISEGKRATKRASGLKGNCLRWHGPDCQCWKESL